MLFDSIWGEKRRGVMDRNRFLFANFVRAFPSGVLVSAFSRNLRSAIGKGRWQG